MNNEKEIRKAFYIQGLKNQAFAWLLNFVVLWTICTMVLCIIFPAYRNEFESLEIIMLVAITLTRIYAPIFNFGIIILGKRGEIQTKLEKAEERKTILEQALEFKTITAKELQELEDIKIKIITLEIDMKLSKGE